MENIRPADNILAIAGELRDKDYNVSQFLQEAKFNPNLTDEQKRQLQTPENNSLVGDLLWKSFK